MSEFWIYFQIGLKHVLDIHAYDHVLFLIALAIPFSFSDWKRIVLLVTLFTIGNQGLETLSTYIYADARRGGLTPELRPLSAIIFVTVLVLLLVINLKAEKKKL